MASKVPHLLDFDNKKLYFKSKIKQNKQKQMNYQISNNNMKYIMNRTEGASQRYLQGQLQPAVASEGWRDVWQTEHRVLWRGRYGRRRPFPRMVPAALQGSLIYSRKYLILTTHCLFRLRTEIPFSQVRIPRSTLTISVSLSLWEGSSPR